MCGIVGVFGRIFQPQERWFEDALQCDVIRGPHSTGVFVIDHKNHWAYYKDQVLPTTLLCTKDYDELKRQQNIVMFGHNRWATKGKVNAQNAHPFLVKDKTGGIVIGMHNGTVWTGKLNNNKKFETDSEELLHSIAFKGIDETWKGVIGGCAIVWWDLRTETLHLIRNDERPLHFAPSADNETLYVASEAWMIRALAIRNNIPIGEIIKPNPHFLFSFTRVPKNEVNGVRYVYASSIKEVKKESRKLESYSFKEKRGGGAVPALPFRGGPGISGGSGREMDATRTGRKLTRRERKALRKQARMRAKDVLPSTSDPNDPLPWETQSPTAKHVSLADFYNQYKECIFCGESLDGQYEDAVIIDERHASCRSCALVGHANGLSLSSDLVH